MFVWSLVCLTQRVCFSLLAYSLRRSCVSVRLGFFFPQACRWSVGGGVALQLNSRSFHQFCSAFSPNLSTNNDNNKNHLRYSQLTYTIVYRCVSYSGAKRLPHSKYPHTVITFMLCCTILCCVAAFLFIRIRKKNHTKYFIYIPFTVCSNISGALRCNNLIQLIFCPNTVEAFNWIQWQRRKVKVNARLTTF